MKRAAPEERAADAGPLFDSAAAWNRAEVGMGRAAAKAERVAPGWRADALAAVREHARAHAFFLAEEIGFHVPAGADPRAFGAVMQDAVREGLVVRDGYAPANSSNRSLKARWRSLICIADPGAEA